jgi:hypothetical protein
MLGPNDVVQVCTPDLSQCQWVPVSEFSVIPALSVQDAGLLSSAVLGLFALAWVARKVRQAP